MAWLPANRPDLVSRIPSCRRPVNDIVYNHIYKIFNIYLYTLMNLYIIYFILVDNILMWCYIVFTVFNLFVSPQHRIYRVRFSLSSTPLP